jgi:hypothetical protein
MIRSSADATSHGSRGQQGKGSLMTRMPAAATPGTGAAASLPHDLPPDDTNM